MARVNTRPRLHPKFLQGEAALDGAAEFILKGLVAGSLLRPYVGDSVEQVKAELKTFLSTSFEGVFPGIRIGRDLVTERALVGFEEVLVKVIKEHQLEEDALVQAVQFLSKYGEDVRIIALLAELEESVCTSSVSEVEEDEKADEEVLVEFSSPNTESQTMQEREELDPEDVTTRHLEPLVLFEAQVLEVQEAWTRFLEAYDKPEHAGEAIFGAILESAPSLQSLFKSQKLIAAKFISGLTQMVMSLHDSTALTSLVEQIGFQHMQIEVDIPQVNIFREAVTEVVYRDLGEMSPLAFSGIQRVISHAGGAIIYIRETFAKRLGLISASWKKVGGNQKPVEDEEAEEQEQAKEATEEDDTWDREEEKAQRGSEAASHSGCCGRFWRKEQTKGVSKLDPEAQKLKEIEEGYQALPRNFESMFRFNVAVMGIAGQDWMYEVLDAFDAMVNCIFESARLQVECNVVSLRIAIVGGDVKYRSFKAVMLSTLRSMLPEEWGPDYEEAWNWLWGMIERLLRKEHKKHRPRERLLGRALGSLEEDLVQKIREQVYDRFFQLAPAGQEYFKQSATRLDFLADRAMELAHALYKDPRATVDEIEALGLRHVGYGVPVELFDPFVEGWRQVLLELTGDENLVEAFHWSFKLLAQLLVRTIKQGATLVMQAINTNSAHQLRRALSYAPRKKRSTWILNVTVVSQSVSPLIMAIEGSNMEAAKAMLEDVMMIRADRSRYYYGADDLFKHHPDLVDILTKIAPELLPTLLDGMIWRSRTTSNGLRRVNYYLKHLLVDSEGQFSGALSSFVKMQDPEGAMHPLLVTMTDLLWNDLVYWRFLRSKLFQLLTTVIFLMSQSVLHRDPATRTALFACRCWIYMGFMVGLIYTRTKHVYQAIKHHEITSLAGIKIPRRYLEDWQEPVSLILTILLVVMFFLEPIIACLQSGEGLFTHDCPEARDLLEQYQILSMIALLLQFTLLVDMVVISTRLSCFVLLAASVLPEFVVMLVAAGYLILSSSCSVSASLENPEDFASVQASLLSFFKLAVGMYPSSNFLDLEERVVLVTVASLFRLVVIFFLLKLLIARITCEYRRMYRSMMGHARLCQMWKICEAVPSLSQRRWRAFIEGLRLDEPLDFGEGDQGLPGGIQVLEPANLHPTNVDRIQRLGGDPKHPFPLEEEDVSEAERCQKLFELFKKQLRFRDDEAASSSGHGSAGRMSIPDASSAVS